MATPTLASSDTITAITSHGIVFGTGSDNGVTIGGEHLFSNNNLLDAFHGAGLTVTPGTTGYSTVAGTPTTQTINPTAAAAVKFVVLDDGTIKYDSNSKTAATGDNAVFGNAYDNTLTGHSTGGSVLYGQDGDDIIKGKGTAANVLSGGDGNDKITAGTGGDTLYGDAGNDKLTGGKGNDVIHGGTGNDSIDGGAGNDTIDGGLGRDQLKGGAGNDTFDFRAADGKGIHDNKSVDTIVDFGKGSDKILLGSDVTVTGHTYDKVLKGMVLTLSDGSKIVLKGVTDTKYTDHVKSADSGHELDWS